MFYAAINPLANINEGKRGFLNTWEIARFNTKAERDEFVIAYENKAAKVVTRKKAIGIFASAYECVGKPVPKGGLFGVNKYGDGNFFDA